MNPSLQPSLLIGSGSLAPSRDTLMRRVVRITLGSLLILVGLVGLVLPILQGFLFLGLGCMLLSRDIPLLARLENRILARFPGIGHTMERVKRALRLKRT